MAELQLNKKSNRWGSFSENPLEGFWPFYRKPLYQNGHLTVNHLTGMLNSTESSFNRNGHLTETDNSPKWSFDRKLFSKI
jgi:hypothetical protein